MVLRINTLGVEVGYLLVCIVDLGLEVCRLCLEALYRVALVFELLCQCIALSFGREFVLHKIRKFVSSTSATIRVVREFLA